MPADLRNALRRPTGTRAARRALPLALVLTVLVVATAGLSGTAHFTGARWVPNLGSNHPAQARTTPIVRVPTKRSLPPRVKLHRATTSWALAAVIAVALMILLNVVWRMIRGRRLAPAAPNLRASTAVAPQARPPEPEPEPAKVLTGIELALQALDEEREPADAVVRAWLGLQETAEESGIQRRVSETPTEFAERVLTRPFADPQPLRTLLRLYLRTRFGDHPVTAEDVSAVRAALEQLQSRWQAAEAGVRSR